MNANAKNELIRKVKEFEERNDSNSSSVYEFEKLIFDIIMPLLGNDGYDLFLQSASKNNGMDFIAQNKNSGKKIGIEYKHRSRAVDLNSISRAIVTAITQSFDKIMLITNSEFTLQCYNTINRVEPIDIELLNLDNIKTWVSKIEVESNLDKLDYENIIKIVSKTFIEKIAQNPNYLVNIEWRELEKMIAEVFEGLAFKVELTSPSKDGGKDIILECSKKGESVSYIVEIKHWRSMQRVGQKSVTDFLKVICRENRLSGLLISTYGFTENAFEGISELERKKIRFGDEDKIVLLCKTYLKVRSGIWTPLNDLQELFYEQTY